jgi:hypothetical protein
MVKHEKFDMNFLPDSYWDEDTLVAKVKVEFRCFQILQAIIDQNGVKQ